MGHSWPVLLCSKMKAKITQGGQWQTTVVVMNICLHRKIAHAAAIEGGAVTQVMKVLQMSKSIFYRRAREADDKG